MSKWGMELKIPNHLFDIGMNNGLYLEYAAQNVTDRVNQRTDEEKDAEGRRFPRYRRRTDVPRNPDGSRVRNEKGQWGEEVEIRGPGDPVTLRSLEDVPEHQRMRSSLQTMPRHTNKRTKRVVVRPMGGREGTPHFVRARAVTNGETQYSKGVPRPWVGITQTEWRQILAEMNKAGFIAFVTQVKPRRDLTKRVQKALAAQQRIARARTRAAKRASQSAARRHAVQQQKLKRWGILPGETAREAYRRQSQNRRIKRRTKRVMRKRNR